MPFRKCISKCTFDFVFLFGTCLYLIFHKGLCGCSEEPGGAGWWLSTDNQRVGAHAGLAQGATGVWYPLFAARAFWWEKPHIHQWQCLRTLCLDLKKYMVGGWNHWPHGSQDDWAVVLPFGLLHVSCKRPFAGRFAETCKLMSLMTANSSEIMVSKVRALVLCSAKLFPCV